MTLNISAAGTANLALMSLNTITSDMTEAQQKISTGKAVSSYSDNPSVFLAATQMGQQVSSLKQNAAVLNNNLRTVNTAMNTATTVASTLTQIRDKLTELNNAETTAATKAADAVSIANLMSAINGIVSDAATASGKSSSISLIGNSNSQMQVSLGVDGPSLAVQGAGLQINAGTPGVAVPNSSVTFTQTQMNTFLGMVTGKYGAGATISATYSVGAVAQATTTAAVNNLLGSTTSSVAVPATAGGRSMRTDTTVLASVASVGANFLAAVNASINNVNAFAKNMGDTANTLTAVLNNNTALQSSLNKDISHLVDADVAAEQVKLSALTVQQQLAVSSLSSISSARQNLLSLFR
jgi:flagellin